MKGQGAWSKKVLAMKQRTPQDKVRRNAAMVATWTPETTVRQQMERSVRSQHRREAAARKAKRMEARRLARLASQTSEARRQRRARREQALRLREQARRRRLGLPLTSDADEAVGAAVSVGSQPAMRQPFDFSDSNTSTSGARGRRTVTRRPRSASASTAQRSKQGRHTTKPLRRSRGARPSTPSFSSKDRPAGRMRLLAAG